MSSFGGAALGEGKEHEGAAQASHPIYPLAVRFFDTDVAPDPDWWRSVDD